jgi:glycerol-3-phosphate dehydrogenase (NAD(P)+)
MKKIAIIGAGAMGSAFTVPCTDNNNEVTLVGTHLENELIKSIKKNKNFHPALNGLQKKYQNFIKRNYQ